MCPGQSASLYAPEGDRVSHGTSFLAPGSLARRRLARAIHNHRYFFAACASKVRHSRHDRTPPSTKNRTAARGRISKPGAKKITTTREAWARHNKIIPRVFYQKIPKAATFCVCSSAMEQIKLRLKGAKAVGRTAAVSRRSRGRSSAQCTQTGSSDVPAPVHAFFSSVCWL